MDLIKDCSVCGRKIKIKINKTKKYSGGNYFGKINFNGNLIEYWECDFCYGND